MPKSQRKVSCDDVCAHSFEWKTYGKITPKEFVAHKLKPNLVYFTWLVDPLKKTNGKCTMHIASKSTSF